MRGDASKHSTSPKPASTRASSPPLARLIAQAAAKAQVWVVTHSDILANALEDETGKRPGRIVKQDGATTIEGLTIGGGLWGVIHTPSVVITGLDPVIQYL